MSKTSAIAVFTGRGAERTIKENGSMAWVLDPRRARKYEYVVCVQNYDARNDWGDASAPHRTAFLVGRLEAVVPCSKKGETDKQRWLLKFSEYARVDIPDAWPGNQNPVFYTDLESFGIKLEALSFRPMHGSADTALIHPERENGSAARGDVTPLSIADAKAGLALKYEVDPANIKIVIEV